MVFSADDHIYVYVYMYIYKAQNLHLTSFVGCITWL